MPSLQPLSIQETIERCQSGAPPSPDLFIHETGGFRVVPDVRDDKVLPLARVDVSPLAAVAVEDFVIVDDKPWSAESAKLRCSMM